MARTVYYYLDIFYKIVIHMFNIYTATINSRKILSRQLRTLLLLIIIYMLCIFIFLSVYMSIIQKLNFGLLQQRLIYKKKIFFYYCKSYAIGYSKAWLEINFTKLFKVA